MQVPRMAVLLLCLAGLAVVSPAKLGQVARSSQRTRGRSFAGRPRARSFNRPVNRARSLGGDQQQGYNYDQPQQPLTPPQPQQPTALYETPSDPQSRPPPPPPPPPQSPPNSLYETPVSDPSPPAPRPPPPPPPTQPTTLYEQPSNNIPVQQPPDNYGPAPSPSPQDPAAGGGMMSGMPYDFEYGVSDPDSGNEYSRQENSDGNVVRGEYRVLLPDGRTQIVRYFDDGNGFNAEVTYE